MKSLKYIFMVAIVVLFAGTTMAACQPYGFEGAYAKYTFNENTVIGSFSGEIKYEITKVWCSNSTMIVKITTSGSIPAVISGKHTDDLNDPEYFPAVPMSDLGKKTIVFSGKTYNLVETKGIEVNAGAFTVYHYRYQDNNEKDDLYIDTSTGLLIKSTSKITTFGSTITQELYDTNIHGISPLLIIFIVLAIAGAVLAVIVAIVLRGRRNRRYIQQQQTQQYYPQQYSQEEEFIEPRQ